MAFGAISSSKNAGYMGFAVTEFRCRSRAWNFVPRRAARDSDLLRYFIKFRSAQGRLALARSLNSFFETVALSFLAARIRSGGSPIAAVGFVAMRTLRKPSLVEWSVCLGAVAVGAAILGVFLSGGLSRSTPEDELASAEGVPSNVREFRSVRARFVSFTVGDYSMEYDAAAPKYHEVLTAVHSNRPIRVWVSKKNEALIPIGSQVTLYKLRAGNRPILSYSEVVGQRAKGRVAGPIIGCALIGLGALVTFACLNTQRRYAASVGPASAKARPELASSGVANPL
jgi:hypothetical protein